MTDGPDIGRRHASEDAGNNVESLATRALAVLASKRANARPILSERLVLELLNAARGDDDAQVGAAIVDILHSGVTGEEVLEFYIPEAARRLGEMWSDDGIGFADVTIAVARLQRELRSTAMRRGMELRDAEEGIAVLVAVPDGEYHTLGAMVITEQFRRMGISVRLCLAEPKREVLRKVAEGQYDAIFYSIAASAKLAEIRDLVEETRKCLSAPAPIVVGGAVGISGLDVKKLTGADHSTTDPKEALRLCGLTTSPPGAKRPVTTD